MLALHQWRGWWEQQRHQPRALCSPLPPTADTPETILPLSQQPDDGELTILPLSQQRDEDEAMDDDFAEQCEGSLTGCADQAAERVTLPGPVTQGEEDAVHAQCNTTATGHDTPTAGVITPGRGFAGEEEFLGDDAYDIVYVNMGGTSALRVRPRCVLLFKRQPRPRHCRSANSAHASSSAAITLLAGWIRDWSGLPN